MSSSETVIVTFKGFSLPPLCDSNVYQDDKIRIRLTDVLICNIMTTLFMSGETTYLD